MNKLEVVDAVRADDLIPSSSLAYGQGLFCTADCIQQMVTVESANAAIAQAERDRRDAERYRWLRNQAQYHGGLRPVVWLTQSHEGDVPDSHITWLDYVDLDEEIDKARSIEKEI